MGRVSNTLAKIAALLPEESQKKQKSSKKITATVRCSISITRSEVQKNILGEVDDEVIKKELNEVLEGFVNGQGGYRFDSWESAFFRNLEKFHGVKILPTSKYYNPA